MTYIYDTYQPWYNGTVDITLVQNFWDLSRIILEVYRYIIKSSYMFCLSGCIENSKVLFYTLYGTKYNIVYAGTRSIVTPPNERRVAVVGLLRSTSRSVTCWCAVVKLLFFTGHTPKERVLRCTGIRSTYRDE